MIIRHGAEEDGCARGGEGRRVRDGSCQVSVCHVGHARMRKREEGRAEGKSPEGRKSPRLARSGVPRFRRFVSPSSREKERAEARDPRRGRSFVGRLLLAASRRVLSLLLTRGGGGKGAS